MESLTVAETETEDDSAYIDIEGKLQLTAESTNNIVKNFMSIYNTYSVEVDADAVFAKPKKASSSNRQRLTYRDPPTTRRAAPQPSARTPRPFQTNSKIRIL